MRRTISFVAAVLVSAMAVAHDISVGYALHGTGTDTTKRGWKERMFGGAAD